MRLGKMKTEENCQMIPGTSEPKLVTNNKGKIDHFRRFGYFLVYWKNDKYEASQGMLLLYYLLWYAGTAGIFAIAYIWIMTFRSANYINRVDDYIEAALVGLFLGFIPSWGIYLLREYATNLPQILMMISRYENALFDHKKNKNTDSPTSEVYKEIDSLSSCEVSYTEGFLENDHNDAKDEVNIQTEFDTKKQWWIVRHGPFVGMFLSLAICASLAIFSFFKDLSTSLFTKTEDSWKILKYEMPFFLMTVIYPLKPYVSLWFCIFFLEWQRNVYESVRGFLRNIKKETNVSESHGKKLEQVVCAVKELQKTFILLNKKIFQKTIVMDFTLFIIFGVFCSWKILQDIAHFPYIIPLSVIFGHIYFVCKWSNDLMQDYNETIEVMNEMTDQDVNNLRQVLAKYPPQVLAFGGFKVNYSMMTAVIVFIFSLIEIYGSAWPETVVECYQFHDSLGRNLTMCIKDETDKGLFMNGTLELRLQKINATYTQ